MISQQQARIALLVDAAGCAAGAVIVGSSDEVVTAVGLAGRRRTLVAAALGATALSLTAAGAPIVPGHRALKRSALVNGAWVGACLVAAAQSQSRLGLSLIAATAVSDAAMAAVQWAASTSHP